MDVLSPFWPISYLGLERKPVVLVQTPSESTLVHWELIEIYSAGVILKKGMNWLLPASVCRLYLASASDWQDRLHPAWWPKREGWRGEDTAAGQEVWTEREQRRAEVMSEPFNPMRVRSLPAIWNKRNKRPIRELGILFDPNNCWRDLMPSAQISQPGPGQSGLFLAKCPVVWARTEIGEKLELNLMEHHQAVETQTNQAAERHEQNETQLNPEPWSDSDRGRFTIKATPWF